MIKISSLNKYYNKGKANEIHVINNTDLVLDDTGLVCILGESGSGKTTLMNTVSGLDSFVSGTIDVDGEVIDKYGSMKQELVRNEKFGYIFQNYYLLMDQTVEYNIMLALSLYDISEDEKEERIDYVLEAVDMARYKKRIVSQLSGGQQQRIAIARALAKTPKVIFADEPTGNLDEANTMRIMSILKKISKECLVVLVTHERSIADFFADRILKISDGKIIDDRRLENHAVYQYNDDNNLYLKEYESKTYNNDAVKVQTYSNVEMEDINIKLVYENNKIYLYTDSELPIEILTDDDEKKMIDSKKPVIELEDVEMEFDLKNIQSSKIPKISFKEMWAMAKSNLVTLGKKQVFLIVSLIVMAVLLVTTVQDIMSLIVIDEEDVVSTDEHIVDFKIKQNKGGITDAQLEEAFAKMYDEIMASDVDAEFYLEPNVYFTYSYEGFWQLASVMAEMRRFSVVSMDKLDDEEIIYGRRGEKQGEIVIDRWVVDLFLDDNPQLANVITNAQHFIGKKITSSESGMQYTIVGISDSGNPDIYFDKIEMMGLSVKAEVISSIQSLEGVDGVDASIQLEGNKALISKSLFENITHLYFNDNYKLLYRMYNGYDVNSSLEELEEQYGITYEEFSELVKNPEKIEDLKYKSNLGIVFNIVGCIPDEVGVQVVIDEGAYDELFKQSVVTKTVFDVYTEDKDELMDYVRNEMSEELREIINVTMVDKYGETMTAYRNNLQVKFDARIIVTVTIFVVSMIILYFMMKANAVSKITDLGVYRLLGISKKSIIGMFALENAVLTTYTSLIGVLGTTIVTKFLGGIPALQMNVVFPWYAILGTIVFLYALNIIVGIMPIRKILQLPPAQLAAKYDI